MSLAVVLTVVTLVTFAVGVVGIARIAKERPSLKSYEQSSQTSATEENMRLATYQEARTKTDLETDPNKSLDAAKSHLRAPAGERKTTKQDPPPQDDVEAPPASLWIQLRDLAMQLLGITLLTSDTTAPSTNNQQKNMGNTATPTLALRTSTLNDHRQKNSAEVDSLASKTSETAPQWSDDEDASAADDESELEEQEDIEGASSVLSMDDLRAQIIMDGVQFYATVAQLSISTTQNVLDIGLLRATTIVLRQRRKAMEDASIQAIEEQYPDIMCLPRFPSPSPSPAVNKPSSLNMETMRGAPRATSIMSPTAQGQLETSFLKAA